HETEFRLALERARSDKALLYQDQAEAIAAEALNALRAIIADPHAPASVRVRAAIAMLDRAAFLPPLPPVETVQPIPVPVHKNAQVPAIARPATDSKTGRNDTCPCGSGIKFKRCCLGKSPLNSTPDA